MFKTIVDINYTTYQCTKAAIKKTAKNQSSWV